MSKKVLIFGYSGFVGPYLAKEFEKDNYIAFGSDIVEPIFGTSNNFSKCNILHYEEVESLIKKVLPDVIVNLAAISSVGQSWKIPQTTISINVVGSLNILESIKQLDKKPKVLFVGSSEEYEISDKPINENNPLNPNNPYGISKRSQELFANIYRERFGIKIYCVRSFNHTGIGQRESFVLPSFCKQVAEIEKSQKPGKIYVGNLNVFRDFSDVRDIVRAYKMVVDSEDDSVAYNIGSGISYSLKDLLDCIISLSNQTIEVAIDQAKYRPVDNPIICCDNNRIRKKLGWEPLYSIEDTLKDMYDYFLNN